MKNITLILMLVLLLFSKVFAQLQVSLEAPSESDGSYFTITAKLQYDYSIDNEFYLDVSFPYGVGSVEIIDSYSWDAKVHKPGDGINHSGNYSMVATDYLVSAHLPYRDGSEDLRLKIRVYPNVSGEIPINYRGTRYKSIPLELEPGFSGNIDQQGWYVYQEVVVHTQMEFPDLIIKDIEVNNNRTFFEDEEVEIEVEVSEINDIDVGKVLVKFYKDGNYIGEDKTSSIDGNETKKASIDYTFTNDKTYSIRAIVDPDDEIVETDETNNRREENVTSLQNHAPTMSNIISEIDGMTYSASWSGTDPDGHDIEYRYKLDNQSWSSWSNNTAKSYINLTYGAHIFYVQCQDELGKNGNDEEDAVTIQDNREITLSSPNGGESWEIGNTENIVWSYTGVPSLIIIELTRDNGNTFEEIARFAEQSIDLFSWIVSTPSSNKSFFRVRIKYPDNTWKEDVSDDVFSIEERNKPPAVEITNIDVSESSVQIGWSGTDPNGHEIKYSYKLDNENWSAFTNTISKNFSGLIPGEHLFYVKCKDQMELEGNTDDVKFNISENSDVSLLSPDGGESFLVDEEIEIKWNFTHSPEMVIIELSRDNGDSFEEIQRFENDSRKLSFWKVLSPTSKECIIRIKCKFSDGSWKEDVSDESFEIYEEYLATYSIVLSDDQDNRHEVISLEPYKYIEDDGKEEIGWFINPFKVISQSTYEGVIPFMIYENAVVPLVKIFGVKHFANLETLFKINIPLPRSWFPKLATTANDPFLHFRIDLGHLYPSGKVNPEVHYHIAIGKKAKKAISFIGQNNYVKIRGGTLGQLINIERPKFLTGLKMSNIKASIGPFISWFANGIILVNTVTSSLNYGKEAHTKCELWLKENRPLIDEILNDPDLEPISRSGYGFVGEYTYENLENTPCEQYNILKVRAGNVSNFCYNSEPIWIDWLNAEDFFDIYDLKYLYNSETNFGRCDNATSWSYGAYVQGAKLKIRFPTIPGYITPEPVIVVMNEPVVEVTQSYVPNGSIMFGLDNPNLNLNVVTPQGITVTEKNHDRSKVNYNYSFMGKEVLLHYGNGDYKAIVNKPDSTIGQKYSLFTQNQITYDTIAFQQDIVISGEDIYGVDSVTNIEHVDFEETIPISCQLSQNYPNPFNPTTTISYSIPKQEHVRIKVYDLLGNEVITLVDKEQPRGNYEVEYDGSNLTNGIYFYRIQTNDLTETKKMILMK